MDRLELLKKDKDSLSFEEQIEFECLVMEKEGTDFSFKGMSEEKKSLFKTHIAQTLVEENFLVCSVKYSNRDDITTIEPSQSYLSLPKQLTFEGMVFVYSGQYIRAKIPKFWYFTPKSIDGVINESRSVGHDPVEYKDAKLFYVPRGWQKKEEAIKIEVLSSKDGDVIWTGTSNTYHKYVK